MEELLQAINQLPGVKGSLIVAKDGILVESAVTRGIDSEVVGAMSAKVCKDIEVALGKATNKKPLSVFFYGMYGNIFFMAIEELILTVVTSSQANIGAIRIVAMKSLKKLIEITE